MDEYDWTQHCRDSLEWAVKMLVFSRFLNAETELFGITLSLIIELPQTVETAQALAQYFYDIDILDPEIQEKLQAVLKEWQGVFLEGELTTRGSIKVDSLPGKSPRGKTLSMVFYKSARKVEKVHRKKAKMFGEYQVFLFDPGSETNKDQKSDMVQNGIVFIGSRPFESEGEYLHFLDMFYAVCLHREVDAEAQTGHLKPLLTEYSEEVWQREHASVAHKAVSNLQKRQSFNGTPSPKKVPDYFRLPSWPKTKASPRSQPPRSPRTKVGLFRSRSFSDVHLDQSRKSKLPQMHAVIERRASSQEDLNLSGLEQPSPRNSPRRNKQNTAKPPLASPRNGMSGRSQSYNELFDKVSLEGDERPVDPLTNPVLPAKLLEHIDFGPGYESTEQLLTWLLKWAGHNHVLSTKADHQGAMRLHMHPRLMVYALWQVDVNHHHTVVPPTNQNVAEFSEPETVQKQPYQKLQRTKQRSQSPQRVSYADKEEAVEPDIVPESRSSEQVTDDANIPCKLSHNIDRKKAKKSKKSKEKLLKKKSIISVTIAEEEEGYQQRGTSENQNAGVVMTAPSPSPPLRRQLFADTVPDEDISHRQNFRYSPFLFILNSHALAIIILEGTLSNNHGRQCILA